MTDDERKNSLDVLWSSAARYRSGKHFRKLMDACVKFRQLAPYNAMLVDMQRPGAKYVLTEKQWHDKYQRSIKPNARPLIILVPFGPVDFVFDISDTVGNGGLFGRTDANILDELAEPYRTRKTVDRRTLNTLMRNLRVNGIALDRGFVSGAYYAARIELLGRMMPIQIPIGADKEDMDWQAPYLLSVRKDAGDGECFASICHELGHLLCGHLQMPYHWTEKRWETRSVGHDVEELEAESVSWLVCERLGVGNPSETYLHNFFDEGKRNGEMIRSVSIDSILSATKYIESMLKPMTYRDGLLYKHEKEFKQAATAKLKQKQMHNGQGFW